ncbi:hypothetical protein LOTGIDRAFT_163514, partial [Lottia gigantea]
MDCEEIVSDVLKLLDILVTPVKQANTGSSSQNLVESLKGNLHKFEDFVEKNAEFKDVWIQNVLTSSVKEDNVSWKFTSYCLKLLDILQENLKKASEKFSSVEIKKSLTPNQAPPLSPDTLSFEQQKHILTSLQFIICLGVCPHLPDGVGIPLSKRSGFSNLLSDLNSESKSDKHLQDAHLKLLICAKVFMTCLDIPSLAVLLLSRHLNDLLALLLQLNHLHKVKVDSLEITGSNKNTITSNTLQKQESESSHTNVLLSSRTKGFCETALKRLLGTVKPSMLVRELIVLQGGPKSKKPGLLPPAPVWLRQDCASFLSDILKKPHGVLHIIHGVVGNEASVPVSQTSLTDWRKCEAAAKIIAHCPRNFTSVDEYYQLIAPQILRLLEDGDNEKMKLYLRVCCSIIKEMYIQNESLTDQYIITPIMNPLLHCLDSN